MKLKHGRKIEGIYKNTERVGQELLCNWVDLPTHYREQFFRAVPEDFDLECFMGHLNFTKQQNLTGYTFINIKPSTFLRYYRDILDMIDRKIVIELREDWMDKHETKEIIEIRKHYPFLLSIDDFGTGASNFDRVKDLQPNFLKIEFSLFKSSPKDLIHFVDFLKRYTKAVLIAEKVETEEDFRLARSCGVEWWSGYYERDFKCNHD